MPVFGSAGTSPGVLKQEQIGKLVTPSAGEEEIWNSLKKFGLKTTKAVGTVVVTCRNGKAEGSYWELIGGASVVRIKASSFMGPGEERDGWTIQLSVTELSVFTFWLRGQL